MLKKIKISPLTNSSYKETVDLILEAKLDTKEEIEHHVNHIEAHFIAVYEKKVVGVIGWYQDNVNYSAEAMGEKFPGIEAYWVGFFAVKESQRNKNIGKMLLSKIENTVLNMGSDKLWVSSVPETEQYYIKQGFKKIMTGKINGNTKIFCVKKLV